LRGRQLYICDAASNHLAERRRRFFITNIRPSVIRLAIFQHVCRIVIGMFDDSFQAINLAGVIQIQQAANRFFADT